MSRIPFSLMLGTVLSFWLTTKDALAENPTDVICAYAPSQSSAVKEISSTIAGMATGTVVTLKAAGLTVVPHASGVYILTGTGGYVAGTMTGATAAVFAIQATIFVGGAALAVELACAPKNYPDLVIKVLKDSRGYWEGNAEKINAFFNEIPESPTITTAKEYWKNKFEQYSK